MALDTREERMSIASTHWNPYQPLPDNDISQQDMLQFMGIYSGFEDDEVGAVWSYVTENNTVTWSGI